MRSRGRGPKGRRGWLLYLQSGQDRRYTLRATNNQPAMQHHIVLIENNRSTLQIGYVQPVRQRHTNRRSGIPFIEPAFVHVGQRLTAHHRERFHAG